MSQRLILHGVARYYGMSSSSAGTVKKRVTTIVAHRVGGEYEKTTN